MSAPDPELGELIGEMLARGLALTMHLADQSKAKDGGKQCCVCGSRFGLECTVPGYGGVFACRSCIEEAPA